jgi:hypothetical protein
MRNLNRVGGGGGGGVREVSSATHPGLLALSGTLPDSLPPAAASDGAKGAIAMHWWRWLCRVLGFSRPVYALSEELRADERRRKAIKRAA